MDEERTPWWAYALTPFFLLFALIAWLFRVWWAIFIIILIIAIPLAIFGVFDKDKTTDFKNCPGYGFVRGLKKEGKIESFDRVEPDSGFLCEYSLDDEAAFVRFKHVGKELEAEVESEHGGNNEYDAALNGIEERGFHK